jgi:glycogen debranching enzyme
VYGDPKAALAFLRPLEHHLGDYGVGSIAEIFDGDSPFAPRGCIAQAWSVAETLRAWLEIQAAASPVGQTMQRQVSPGFCPPGAQKPNW